MFADADSYPLQRCTGSPRSRASAPSGSFVPPADCVDYPELLPDPARSLFPLRNQRSAAPLSSWGR
jgi:hypothetical protein